MFVLHHFVLPDLGGTGLAVINTTANAELAWEYLEQMVDEQMLELMGNYTGVPPPYDAIIEKDYWYTEPIKGIIAQQV